MVGRKLGCASDYQSRELLGCGKENLERRESVKEIGLLCSTLSRYTQVIR